MDSTLHAVDASLLQCPNHSQLLSYDEPTASLRCERGDSFAIQAHGPSAYVRFLNGGSVDLAPVERQQREVYDSEKNRYVGQRNNGFMERFVTERMQGKVKGKEDILLKLIRRCKLQAENRILEIGCNDGRYLNYLVSAFEAVGCGIDISEQSIQRAVEQSTHPVRSQYFVGAASRLPFVENAFDLVMALDVFEHLGHTDFATTMKECARILKPGALLLVYVVSQKDRYTFHETLRRITNGRMGVDDQEGHAFENFLLPDFFRRVAQETGFTVEQLQAYHGFWTLFVDEHLRGAMPAGMYKLLEMLDAPLTDQEYGNGFFALARKQ